MKLKSITNLELKDKDKYLQNEDIRAVMYLIDTSISMLPWLAEPSEIEMFINLMNECLPFVSSFGFNRYYVRFQDEAKMAESLGVINTFRDQLNNYLIFVITDFVSDVWKNGKARDFLYDLGRDNHVILVSTTPERLDSRCALNDQIFITLKEESLGYRYNKNLKFKYFKNYTYDQDEVANRINISPIFPFVFLNYFINHDNSEDEKLMHLNRWLRSYSIDDPLEYLNFKGKNIPFSEGYYDLALYFRDDEYIEECNRIRDKYKETNKSELEIRRNSFYGCLAPDARKLAFILIDESLQYKVNDLRAFQFDIIQVKKDIYNDKTKGILERRFKFNLDTVDLLEIFLNGFIRKEEREDYDKLIRIPSMLDPEADYPFRFRYYFEKEVIYYLIADPYKAFSVDLKLESEESDLYKELLELYRKGEFIKGRKEYLKIREFILAIEQKLLAELKDLSANKVISSDDVKSLIQKYVQEIEEVKI